MPKNKENIRRLCAIYMLIYNHNYPSKKKILSRLDTILGYHVCESTVEKDMFNIRTDFDVNIQYSRENRGYYLCGENCEPITFVTKIFEYLNLKELKIIEECLTLMKNKQ